MPNKPTYLLLLLTILLHMACQSKSGQQVNSGDVAPPPVTPWVSEVNEKPDSTPEIQAFVALPLPETIASKETIEGKVIGIIDGDTYDLLNDSKQTIRIRMEGIDAPERGMPFYQVSKKHLSSLCFGKRIAVRITQAGSGTRKIGFTYLADGRELSHEMIRAGLAWHFIRYNSDRDLSALEREARKARRGLWKDPNPVAPWEIRKIRRSGESTRDLFHITEDQQ